ncbi:hypothetical protein EON83_01650 [bacterium]|nr:MAG: hypothetical protein EON83_01650 [bacterium]
MIEKARLGTITHPTRKYLMHGLLMTAALIEAPAINTAFAQAPTPANLEQNFVTPPASSRPWVYWFVMDGNFSREGITADLEAMKAAGIGGVIFMEGNVGIPRGPVKFMSPEWQQLWKHVVKESERLGLSITLNGGPGWTGSGGPWVKAPLSMQITTYSTLDVKGPTNFDAVVPRPENRSRMSDFYQDIRVLAFPTPTGDARLPNFNQKTFIDRGPAVHGAPAFLPSYSQYPATPTDEAVDSSKIVDLTSKMDSTGRLNWAVPAGNWTIIRVGATNNGNSTFPAPEAGIGMESDKFSRAGFDAHFNSYVGTLMKTVGPRKISPDYGWNMLHIDSWEVGVQNWTPAFLGEFKKRRGYDAVNLLPALSGLIIDSTEKTERFLWDWRQTCSELLTENHVAYFRTLGHKHGFGLSIEPYDKVVGSDVSLGGAADVPMGEFWAYDPPPETNFSITEAASSAHTNGKKIVGAESFTSGGSARWLAHPASIKSLGDWALTEGINRIVFHRYQHQPTLTQFPGMTMGGYGIQWERTQTWWDLSLGYHRYLSRSQYLLRQGLPVSDVCYLIAEGAPQVFRAPKSATKNNPPERLGYSFDAIAPENLLGNMTVKDGRLTLPDGTNYRVLVLPERDTITPELLQKVSDLVKAGATVIGPRPAKSPSLSGFERSDAKVRQLAAEMWGDCDGLKVTEHQFGKGRVIWHKGADDLSQERPSGLSPAQWIWFPEGRPASGAPAGKRYFQRAFTIEDVSQIASAQVFATADNSVEVAVNKSTALKGDDYHQIWSADVTSKLKNGQNIIDMMAENGKSDDGSDSLNPAGLIGNLRLTYYDGRVVNIPTDKTWQSATTPNATQWVAALSMGGLTMGPWNLNPNTAPQQYGDFSIAANALASMKVPVDFASDGPIRYIHRRDGDEEIYFIANREETAVTANCTFRVSGKQPELWNPVTGEHRLLTQFQMKGAQTTIPIKFEAAQSWFVIFKPMRVGAKIAQSPNFPAAKKVMELSGPWQVSFDPKWCGPANTTFPKLSDWSQNTDKGIRFYSGKAVYRKTFNAPKASSERTYLDLGNVKNLAKVRLNGNDIGFVWCAPWRVNVTGKLKPGANQLEITVANLWPNRLIGDAALPEGMRSTRTTWSPYTATSKLLPSGLIGPVTLTKEAN